MHHHSHLDGMLDQAQAVLTCPVCHRRFQREELRVRGMFERHGIVQATCSHEHNATVVIFMADEHPATSGTVRNKPLTADDVLELHRALETFDGNFRRALKTSR